MLICYWGLAVLEIIGVLLGRRSHLCCSLAAVCQVLLISRHGFSSAGAVLAGNGVLCLMTSAFISLEPKKFMRVKKLVAC